MNKTNYTSGSVTLGATLTFGDMGVLERALQAASDVSDDGPVAIAMVAEQLGLSLDLAEKSGGASLDTGQASKVDPLIMEASSTCG